MTMDHFDEIKNIWQSRPAGMQPSLSGFNEAVRSFQSAQRRNILLLILLSVICLAAMVWVMVDYQSALWTTRAGELIFLVMGLYLFYTKMNQLRKNNREEWLSARDFLDNLMENSKNEAKNRTRVLIFIVLAVAFSLPVRNAGRQPAEDDGRVRQPDPVPVAGMVCVPTRHDAPATEKDKKSAHQN